jgi:ribonuclease P protein component
MSEERPSDTPRPHRFGQRFRLRHAREFDAVYAAKGRIERFPLIVQTMPSTTGDARLGLAIGRRFGPAVRRNRMKRLLRECFRQARERFPAPYDVVIGCRPHGELPLARYAELLDGAIAAAHLLWTKRHRQPQTPRPAVEPPRSPPDS